MKKSILLLIVFTLGCTIYAQNKMPGFTIDPLKINTLRDKFASGEKTDAVKKLLKDAKELLSEDVVTIMDKEAVPPSGDKHDFMSLSKYWWPDPSKPDGLPYIRKDGKVNPEVKKITDDEYKSKMIQTIEILSYAFYITGDKKYSEAANKWLNAWFINPDTKMNPNMNYAQFVPGRSEGRSFGIIDTHAFYELLNGISLLEHASGISAEDLSAIKKWFTDYLKWLQTSENGIGELNAKNNHGWWYDVQVVAIMEFLRDYKSAKQHLENVTLKRHDVQIEPDGRLPEELVRTTSWQYSSFCIKAIYNLALLGERAGVDLWNYENPKGGSLRKAIDFIAPFAVDFSGWKYEQIKDIKKQEFLPALILASYKYDDKIYSEWIEKIYGNSRKISFEEAIL